MKFKKLLGKVRSLLDDEKRKKNLEKSYLKTLLKKLKDKEGELQGELEKEKKKKEREKLKTRIKILQAQRAKGGKALKELGGD